MEKQNNISKKIEKSREKLENLKFAYEHSLDEKDFLDMIESEKDKLRDLKDELNEERS